MAVIGPILMPMLAEPATKAIAGSPAFLKKLSELCDSPRYFSETKVDGHRLVIHVGQGEFDGVSRKGLDLLGVTDEIRAEFNAFRDGGVRWVFDGELLNRTFYLFDLIEAGAHVDPSKPFEFRRAVLETFYEKWSPGPAVKLLTCAKTSESKRFMAAEVEAQCGEGLMFKDVNAPYLIGRKAGIRSKAFLKLKYRHDIDCVVMDLGRGRNSDGNVKQNMVLGLFKPGSTRPTEVGECGALTGDGPRVQVGDVVTVILLYSTDDNRLYQPTMPKIRLDKAAEECGWDQLDLCRTNKYTVFAQ